MNRPIAWVVAGLAGFAGVASGQTPAEREKTVAYVLALRNPDGGYAPKLGQASGLGSTSSAIRTIGYAGGTVPDPTMSVRYVRSCFDPTTGGFAPSPGGKADIGTTAAGLMAVGALKLDPKPFAEGAVGFFSRNARTFEEVRIAVAGLEAVGAASPDFPRWAVLVKEGQDPDGTFGTGPARARATGSRVVALLRMGMPPDPPKKAAILKALRDSQREDGGWSESGGPSDQTSTYRIMRCFFMLGEKPDLARLRKYIDAHRQPDGGYAPKPGAGSDLGGTYTCSIMDYWARKLEGGEGPKSGAVPLFNGKDLSGWEGDTSLWSAVDGVLVGASPGIKQNNFLATEANYGDFVLSYRVRLMGDSGNSGVQFRSVRVPGHEMSGYQADIGPGYWGCLYDESRRNRVLAPASPRAMKALRPGDWNDVTVRAVGDHVTITLNGETSVDYREADPAIPRVGRIAVQIHSGGPMRVEFKDVMIRVLGADAK